MRTNKIRKTVIAIATIMVMSITGITPVAAASKEVPITGITFPSKITMKVGETKTYKVSVKPGNTTYKTNIAWGSQTDGHFTDKVNGYGTCWGQASSVTLKAKSVGTGYLNATVEVYDSRDRVVKNYEFDTTVKVVKGTSKVKRPLKKIKLNKTKVKVRSGKSVKLSVIYVPSNTTVKKTIKWVSKNPSVARVKAGKVIAGKVGTTTIIAKVGSKTAKCRVTVTAKPKTKKKVTKETTRTVSGNGIVSVGSAYTELNRFRTTGSVWQWNPNNRTKTYFNTGSGNTLKPLTRDAALEKTAQLRAKEIATVFSHARPNGTSCFTAYPSYMDMGENIACGQTSARMVTEDWKETNEYYADQGHRRNMLNKNYNVVGIGCYKKNGTLYWVQCFGRR